jgi:hypothetical protein
MQRIREVTMEATLAGMHDGHRIAATFADLGARRAAGGEDGLCHDAAISIMLDLGSKAAGWTWCEGTADGVRHSWVEFGAPQ